VKKRNKILIGMAILILLGYFCYKGFNLIYYHSFYTSDFGDDLEIVDHIRLNYHEELKEKEEYLEFKNIKIRNDFKNFNYRKDISTDNIFKYVLYDKDNEIEASFWVSENDNYVKMLNSDIDIYAYNRKGIKIKNIKNFLKSNGINNDIHLFKYLVEHKDDKNTIFTSVNEIKARYSIYSLIEIMFPNIESITFIDGTYAGYMLELDNDVKQVGILYYDKCYVFTFVGEEYFNNEYIFELLDTLVIESAEDDENKFIRTYNIVETVENNSLEYNSFKVKMFQGEEAVVDIKKELSKDIVIGKNYEFTFKKNDISNIKDDIKSIFESAEIINIIETDKVGLEQVQENIK